MDKDVRESIILAALTVAREDGYKKFTRTRVAKKAGVSQGLVSYYFGEVKDLWVTTIEEAIKRKESAVVAQGLFSHCPAAMSAPRTVRMAALKSLL